MATNDRVIARLILQIERVDTTLRHLTAMALETKNVLDERRGELRAARAVMSAKQAKNKRHVASSRTNHHDQRKPEAAGLSAMSAETEIRGIIEPDERGRTKK